MFACRAVLHRVVPVVKSRRGNKTAQLPLLLQYLSGFQPFDPTLSVLIIASINYACTSFPSAVIFTPFALFLVTWFSLCCLCTSYFMYMYCTSFPAVV